MANSPTVIKTWLVGTVFTDGNREFPAQKPFTDYEDADRLFTRLEDARFPGDGIDHNFIKEVTVHIVYTKGIQS